jgi:hypothetical protein
MTRGKIHHIKAPNQPVIIIVFTKILSQITDVKAHPPAPLVKKTAPARSRGNKTSISAAQK